MALIGGFVLMYHTQAFWGLEDNPNAYTINTTFNTVTGLVPILITVVLVIAVVLVMSISKAF